MSSASTGLLMIFKKGLEVEVPALKGLKFLPYFFLPAILLVCSCSGSETGQDETKLVQEMAESLPEGRAMLLDAASSSITWKIRQQQGAWLSGIFRPERGFLLLEGSAISAGFFEGDFFKSNQLTDSSKGALAGAAKFLKDSVPQLFRPGGSYIRFDLKQNSRVIPKSEFRSAGQSDSLAPSHDATFLAEIADSTQTIRFPLRISSGKDFQVVTGHYQLNLRDFGVLSRSAFQPGAMLWVPEVSLELRLVFKQKPLVKKPL